MAANIFTTFRSKLAFWITLLVSSVSLFVFFYFPGRIMELQYSAIEEKVVSVTRTAGISSAGGIYFKDYKGIENAISPILLDQNILFLVIEDIQDSIHYAYNIELAEKSNFRTALPEKISKEKNKIIVSSPIELFDIKVGNIYVGYSLEQLNILMDDVRERIFYITTIIILLGILLSIFIGKLVTTPLQRVVQTVNDIAAGDLTKRARADSRDEIADLANSFNVMVEKIITANKLFENRNKDLQREIIARERIEANLRESESRFRSVFENASLGIFEMSKTGFIHMANDSLLTLLNIPSVDALENINLASYFKYEKDRTNFTKIINENEEISGYESAWLVNKNTVYVRLSIKSVRYKHASDIIYVGIVEDITLNKEAELELTENEYRYRTLFNISPSGIVLENKDGIIIDVNPAFCKSLGYTREELLGQHIKLIADPTVHKQVEENIHKVLEGNVLVQTVRSKSKSGEFRYMDLSEAAIPLPDGTTGILSIVNDISDRISYEQELIKAKENAERSDRLKTEFLAQMSHEIRTPINTILNFASLLKMEISDNISEDNKSSFNSIENAARRLMRTIDLVLNMSEIETDSYEADYNEYYLYRDIIKPMWEEFNQQAKNKNLELLLYNNLKKNNKVFADRYTLSQSIINLVDNAIKYTTKGKVEIVLEENHEKTNIHIVDTGIGIKDDYIPNLFKKFRQEEQGYTRQFEGNGLGLALVKKYCEINNAEIIVESVKGKGSKFSISIPYGTKKF